MIPENLQFEDRSLQTDVDLITFSFSLDLFHQFGARALSTYLRVPRFPPPTDTNARLASGRAPGARHSVSERLLAVAERLLAVPDAISAADSAIATVPAS